MGRAVVADALRETDPTGARAAEQTTGWRTDYLVHFRRLVEAGLSSPEAALSVAQHGADSLHERMRVLDENGAEHRLDSWPDHGPDIQGVEVVGRGEPVRELVLPYRGERLRGDEMRRRLDAWVEAGVVEPSVADAVAEGVAHPEWLRLDGRTVAVLGAGAEMGPLPSLMRWGAPGGRGRPAGAGIWERVLRTARGGAGTLVVPSAEGDVADRGLAGVAGMDLLAEVPEVATWLHELPGRLVVGNYVYADGGTNMRVSVAVDALTTRLGRERAPTSRWPSWRRRPTCSRYPRDAVEQSTRAYEGRSGRARPSGGRCARCRGTAAAACLRPGLRPRDHRLAGAAAGTELRAGQAAAALACTVAARRRARPCR